MFPSIIVRSACTEDYHQFWEAEKEAWEGAEVPLVNKEQFRTWLEIFPAGLLLAEIRGKVCGHLFSQICSFDPYDFGDNRDWDTITDYGYARATHNPFGSTLYAVSFSASFPGAGRLLLKATLALTRQLNLQYFAGACRVPGLAAFAQHLTQPIDVVAQQYVQTVVERMTNRKNTDVKFTDPTLTVVLSVRGMVFCRLVKDYFHDKKSGNWASLVAYTNENYSFASSF